MAAPTVTLLKATGNQLKLKFVTTDGTALAITGAALVALLQSGTVPAGITGNAPAQPLGPPIQNLSQSPLWQIINPAGGYASAAAAQAVFDQYLRINAWLTTTAVAITALAFTATSAGAGLPAGLTVTPDDDAQTFIVDITADHTLVN